MNDDSVVIDKLWILLCILLIVINSNTSALDLNFRSLVYRIKIDQESWIKLILRLVVRFFIFFQPTLISPFHLFSRMIYFFAPPIPPIAFPPPGDIISLTESSFGHLFDPWTEAKAKYCIEYWVVVHHLSRHPGACKSFSLSHRARGAEIHRLSACIYVWSINRSINELAIQIATRQRVSLDFQGRENFIWQPRPCRMWSLFLLIPRYVTRIR